MRSSITCITINAEAHVYWHRIPILDGRASYDIVRTSTRRDIRGARLPIQFRRLAVKYTCRDRRTEAERFTTVRDGHCSSGPRKGRVYRHDRCGCQKRRCFPRGERLRRWDFRSYPRSNRRCLLRLLLLFIIFRYFCTRRTFSGRPTQGRIIRSYRGVPSNRQSNLQYMSGVRPKTIERL